MALASSHALAIGESSVRQIDGLYSLNDLHKAAGGHARHQPALFLRRAAAQALIAEIQSTNSQTAVKAVNGGDGRGTYACRELVIAYAAWISAAFHLKVIQVFLAQHDQPKPVPALPVQQQPTLMGRRFLVCIEGGQERITALAPNDSILNPNNISNLIRSGSSGLDQLGGVHE